MTQAFVLFQGFVLLLLVLIIEVEEIDRNSSEGKYLQSKESRNQPLPPATPNPCNQARWHVLLIK